MKKFRLTQYDSDAEDYEDVLPENEDEAMKQALHNARNRKPAKKPVKKKGTEYSFVKPQPALFVSGATRRIGYIGITYDELVRVLGVPKKMKTGSDMHAMWVFKIKDETDTGYKLYTIYDDYFPDDKPIDSCVLWTIGGSSGSMNRKYRPASIADIAQIFPKALVAVGEGTDFWNLVRKVEQKYGKEALAHVETAAPPSGVPSTNKKSIKQAQENIRKIRKKRDVDLKNSTDKIRRLQDKIHDLKFQNVPARDNEEAKMKAKYNALARLQVLSASLVELVEKNLDSWNETQNDQYIINSARTISQRANIRVGQKDIKEGEALMKSLSLNKRLSGGADLTEEDYAKFLVFCENNHIDVRSAGLDF